MTSGAQGKMAAPMGVLLEFGGGAELLFQGIKKHHVTLPGRPDPWDIRQLLVWIKENLLKERPELFIQGDTVKLRYGELFDENIIPDHSVHVTDVYRRPGILVLINDADWELMGELDYKIQDRDNIVFISTLHGG